MEERYLRRYLMSGIYCGDSIGKLLFEIFKLRLHISGSITLLGRLELLDLRWVARFPSWQLLRNARPRAHPTALYPSAGYPPTAFARTSSSMVCRFNVIFLGLRRAERLRH